MKKKEAVSEDVFIANVKVVDPNSPFNNKKVDILISDGIITRIGKDLKEPFGATRIEGKNMTACPGFVDMHVNVQDPGFEFKEDIDSALKAAAQGGYTGILSASTTDPVVDNKSGVEYQIRKSKGHLTDLWVSGSLSKNQKGKELAEMYDMHKAGALAFYDFKSNVNDSQLLKLALLYVKSFDGLIMLHPSEHFLTSGGEVNEGEMSTRNGLKGIPAIAEEIGIHRALKIAEYTDQKIHFTSVSTIEGLDLIKKARKKGIKVSCGVSVANLLYNEGALDSFDSNFKVNPPLRDEKTRKALIDGLKSGIIDVVVSDHWPQNVENKECEFEVADFGMSTLENAISMVRTATDEKIEIPQLVDILSMKPRKILGLDIPAIKEKESANISVIQFNEKVESSELKYSLGANQPSFPEMKGKVVASINNAKVHLNS